jgi:hypothetical protein
MQLKAFFPRDGSAETPPHPSADFRWKDYCPMAFGKLREVFHIEAAEFMKSICGATAQPQLAVVHEVFNVCYCHTPCLQRLPRGGCWGRASTLPSHHRAAAVSASALCGPEAAFPSLSTFKSAELW